MDNQPAMIYDGTPANPNGCGVCGADAYAHHQRLHPTGGLHTYQTPTDAQRRARMMARRAGATIDAASALARAKTVAASTPRPACDVCGDALCAVGAEDPCSGCCACRSQDGVCLQLRRDAARALYGDIVDVGSDDDVSNALHSPDTHRVATAMEAQHAALITELNRVADDLDARIRKPSPPNSRVTRNNRPAWADGPAWSSPNPTATSPSRWAATP